MLQPANTRSFDFAHDTLAYANQLDWDYRTDFATGVTTARPHVPAPSYSQHCIIMARTTRQFFQFARFEPARHKVGDDTYRGLIRDVIAHDPSETNRPDRIVIPGYADLRSFSAAKENLLKSEIGTWAGTYLQLGNWRMIFPFGRGHQEHTANTLLEEIRVHRPPVIHLVRFPRITINHAVVAFAAAPTESGIRFMTYDPNYPDEPQPLFYERKTRSFSFGPNKYFGGGLVNVYEIYRSGMY